MLGIWRFFTCSVSSHADNGSLNSHTPDDAAPITETMKRRLLLLTPIALLLIAAIVLAIAPGAIIRPLLGFALANQGVILLRLDNAKFGLAQFSSTLIELESEGTVVRGENLLISFNSAGNFRARVNTAQLDSLDVDLAPAEDAEATSNPLDLLEQIRSLPINHVEIRQFRLNAGDWHIAGGLSLKPGPLEVSATAQWSSLPGLEIGFSSHSDEEAGLDTRLIIQTTNEAAEELVSVAGSVVLTDEALLGNTEFSISLQSLFNTDLLPIWGSEWRPQQEQINGLLEFGIATENNILRLQSARLELTHPEEELRFTRTRDDGNLPRIETALVQLPVNLSAETKAMEQSVTLFVPALNASLHTKTADADIQVDSHLTNISLTCLSPSHCNGSTELSVHSPANSVSGIMINNAALEGRIQFELSPEAGRVTAPSVRLLIPTVMAEGILAKADLELLGLEIDWRETVSASAQFAIRDSELTVNGIALLEPTLSGALRIENKLLSGTAAFGLAGEQLLTSTYSHDFSSGAGATSVSLDEFRLTESRPLSSYLLQGQVAADVISGVATADANITWQLQSDQTLSVSGPVNLQIEDASGYLQETVLVGVKTSLRGQFTDSFHVRSEPAQVIEISGIDLGMPLANLAWQYQFDTAAGTWEIINARANLLGGEISIADFVYDQNLSRQQMTVVLSGINLESVVALADYPELFIDGYVSGYIPLTLEEGKLQVNDGLIAALNPGGTIRYDSPATSTNANASVQLVNDALSNYQYKTMDTRVFYDSNGDLRMEVRLAGLNPEMNGGQAINLNVNITDNIPTLLRSLRAGKAISERLEERLRAQ